MDILNIFNYSLNLVNIMIWIKINILQTRLQMIGQLEYRHFNFN